MGAEPTSAGQNGKALFGLLAEFETPGALIDAARKVRDAGYTKWDCYTPFPVHGLDRAMALRDTKLPWLVMGAGAAGTTTAILMQSWMNGVNYPLVISGKPLFSIPAQIPIAFELTVLFAAVCAFSAMFVFNGLPQFHHPVFGSKRFKRATDDRFFIAIEAEDPVFDAEKTERLLRSAGSEAVEWLED